MQTQLNVPPKRKISAIEIAIILSALNTAAIITLLFVELFR